MAAVHESLGDDADRIGEVDDPRMRRGMLSNQLGELESDRYGPKRLGEPAGANRLLTDQVEASRQSLVAESGGLSPDSELQ